jgi:ABC-type cobalamin/Fe3+-siderophores transport system ATPase subunit
VLRLLYRLYDTQGGAVLVGGQDTRAVQCTSLRRNIGVVPQVDYQNPNLKSQTLHPKSQTLHSRSLTLAPDLTSYTLHPEHSTP